MPSLPPPAKPDAGIGAPRVGEDAWLAWLAESGIAGRMLEADLADASARRLVVVAPHPDDEVLACGGLAARWAHAGGTVAVVAVTDGEASHPDDPAWPPGQLAAARRQESARGLAQLGVDPSGVVRLGLPDGDVARHAERLDDALRACLRPGDLVVTTWRLDGHPDHEATGAAAARVAGDLGCALLEAPVWMWHGRVPADPSVPWARMRALPLTPAERAAKQRAIAAHATQLAPRARGEAPVLDAPILARAGRGAEYFLI